MTLHVYDRAKLYLDGKPVAGVVFQSGSVHVEDTEAVPVDGDLGGDLVGKYEVNIDLNWSERELHRAYRRLRCEDGKRADAIARYSGNWEPKLERQREAIGAIVRQLDAIAAAGWPPGSARARRRLAIALRRQWWAGLKASHEQASCTERNAT